MTIFILNVFYINEKNVYLVCYFWLIEIWLSYIFYLFWKIIQYNQIKKFFLSLIHLNDLIILKNKFSFPNYSSMSIITDLKIFQVNDLKIFLFSGNSDWTNFILKYLFIFLDPKHSISKNKIFFYNLWMIQLCF